MVLAASDGFVTHLAAAADLTTALNAPAAPAPPTAPATVRAVPDTDAEFFAVYAPDAVMDEPGVIVCRTVAQGQQVDIVYTRDGLATPAPEAVERYTAAGYPVIEIVPVEATQVLHRWGISDQPTPPRR